jgi:hypothetical protein
MTEQTLESPALVPKPRKRAADLTGQPEYLLLDECAVLLRFDVTAPSRPRAACWAWLERHAVPVLRRGRVFLIEREVLTNVLRRM